MVKFVSKPISEHEEVPLADGGEWEKIVATWSPPVTDARASYVVSVGSDRDPDTRAAQLAEILALVENQDGNVVGHEVRTIAEPNPRTLLGKGTARDIAARARACGATMLVIDAELTPSQARNLEDAAGMSVCDREAVILNVFLRHARTRRARIQVEVAQLEYLRPRIRGIGIDMDQQTGASTRSRGAGETASELLARKLDRRLAELRKQLGRLDTATRIQRSTRRESRRVVLVGYTNAGKTTLMNALTSSELSARDMPFETLDTTSRCLSRHGGEVIVSDTVGFIRRLPERLLASFDSTLSEIEEATLLVVVADASDVELIEKVHTTIDVLGRIGADAIPRLYVFNKIDRGARDRAEREALAGGYPSVALSAHDPKAVAALREQLIEAVRGHDARVTVFVPYERGAVLASIYARCRVLETASSERGLELSITAASSVIADIEESLARRTA